MAGEQTTSSGSYWPRWIDHALGAVMGWRMGFIAVMILGLFCLASGVVILIQIYRPDKDNSILFTIIFGFVTTNVAVLINKLTFDFRTDKQDIKLEDISQKVNGGSERAMSALREQHRIELHDMKNEIGQLKLKLAEATVDKENALKAQYTAESRAKECELKVTQMTTALLTAQSPPPKAPNVQGT